MDRVVIRPFVPSDRDAVLALAPRLTIGVARWRDPAAVATAVRGWLEASTEPSQRGLALVAVVEGRITGFISAEASRHFAGEADAYIGELVVDERAEGQGIATRLVHAAERWAVANGHRCITLNTGAANERARHLYRHLGFEEEDVKLTRVLSP
jgi:ribosomal protein S18 acetylase RimI-like enzyme